MDGQTLMAISLPVTAALLVAGIKVYVSSSKESSTICKIVSGALEKRIDALEKEVFKRG